jgi:hypothetical protein
VTLLLGRVEEVLRKVPFHGWGIGCTVAPLEG